MRKAQSVDPVKIAEALRGTDWDGLYGPEAFGMKSVYGIDTTITRRYPDGRDQGRQAGAARDGRPGRRTSEPADRRMTLALQIVTSGLVTGLIYMLIALGVTLLFGIMRVVNFVHGELVMLSAFAVYFLVSVRGRAAVLAGAAGGDRRRAAAGRRVLPVRCCSSRCTMRS